MAVWGLRSTKITQEDLTYGGNRSPKPLKSNWSYGLPKELLHEQRLSAFYAQHRLPLFSVVK
jgi:hypothetical protein